MSFIENNKETYVFLKNYRRKSIEIESSFRGSRKLQSMSLSKNPWKSAEMPWTYNGPAINLMQFNGVTTLPDLKKTQPAPVKRKIEDDSFM